MQACANYACPLRFIPLISTGFGGFSISFQSFLMFSWSVVGSAPPRPRRWLSGLRAWMISSPTLEALASLWRSDFNVRIIHIVIL